MQRRSRRLLAVISAVAAVAFAAPAAVAAPQEAASESELAATRPAFRMPFECGQRWLGSNWNGHSPGHSIDWNHYAADGSTDDYGRRVFASAGGKVIASYYSTSTGYGNTVVVGHGNGWQTRYAHLKTRAVQRGDSVNRGQKLGRVGKSSALYNLSPHLHYEQIHNGQVVVSVIQGVRWYDYLKRYQTSKNRCG
ncbi:M23 family metallopeptidase [Streptomyces sp. N2-109]|uniref:M23 family metallopeptidase n=1 Tax=Streptomyces gossypii TaxID=2883101 RepID=A0ABT2JUQ7_9ACTN|nr:M23 family metallopeptidase [Streptomyces gossypii]MCT2591024.1 M23 family metallopeptidase [Streptomyces gossypii]